MPDYVICTTQRSGSTFLCECMTRTGVLGHSDEWLVFLEYDADRLDAVQSKWQTRLLRDIIRWQAGQQRGPSRQAMMGWKIMWSTMRRMKRQGRVVGGDVPAPNLDDQALFRVIDTELGAPRYVFFERANKIAQAISHIVLQRTDIPHVRSDRELALFEGRKRLLDIGDGEITRNLAAVLADEAAWNDFFTANNIAPLRMVYEDFISDVPAGLDSVAAFLGIAALPPLLPGRGGLRKTGSSFEQERARAYLTALVGQAQS